MSGSTRPRPALRAAVATYILEHGLANLSLRPLAAATGTSARMLLYHFGSKERLIAEAMAEIRARQRKLVEERVRRRPAASLAELFEFAWSWVSDSRHEPYLRLFLELLGRGIRRDPHFQEFARTTFEDWICVIQSRLEKEGRPAGAARASAILAVATVRGLALYYLATKDRRGARLALRAFLQRPARQQGG
jgi:AcrR family transcriptional regulator